MENELARQNEGELSAIVRKYQTVAPAPGDTYWSTNKVFVQLVSVDIANTDDKALATQVHANFRISSLNDEALWHFFSGRKAELESVIKDIVKRYSDDRLEVKEIRFHRGSIEILLVFIAAIAAYPHMKVLANDLMNVMPQLLQGITAFFQSFSGSMQAKFGFKNGFIIGVSLGIGLIWLLAKSC